MRHAILRHRISRSPLGVSGVLLGALIFVSLPGSAVAGELGDWAQHLRRALAPEAPVTTVLTIEADEVTGTEFSWPLTVELTRRPMRDGSHALAAKVVTPFDMRGSTYWVESTPNGVQKEWVYVPALRRVRQLTDDSPWVHPGLRTIFRLEEVARAVDWQSAQIQRVAGDRDGWIQLSHEVPGTGDRIEARLDAARRVPTELTLRGEDGGLRASLRFSQFQEVAGQPVPFAIEVATAHGPDHRIEVTQYYVQDDDEARSS